MAGFNIEGFRSQVSQRGIQKPNKYLIRFTPPPGLTQAENRTTLLSLEYWCEASLIPGVMIHTHPVLRFGYGVPEKKPIAIGFNDWNVTVLSDGAAENWSLFQNWVKFVVNYDMRAGIQTLDPTSGASNTSIQDPFELSYKNEYATNIDVTLYNDAGQESIRVVLREAYPIFVGDIPLNYADNNVLLRIPVTFTFSDWYNVSGEIIQG